MATALEEGRSVLPDLPAQQSGDSERTGAPQPARRQDLKVKSSSWLLHIEALTGSDSPGVTGSPNLGSPLVGKAGRSSHWGRDGVPPG